MWDRRLREEPGWVGLDTILLNALESLEINSKNSSCSEDPSVHRRTCNVTRPHSRRNQRAGTKDSQGNETNENSIFRSELRSLGSRLSRSASHKTFRPHAGLGVAAAVVATAAAVVPRTTGSAAHLPACLVGKG